MNPDPIPGAGTDLVRVEITRQLEAILPYPKSEIAGFVDGIFRAIALYRKLLEPEVKARLAERIGRECDRASRARALRGRNDLDPETKAKLRDRAIARALKPINDEAARGSVRLLIRALQDKVDSDHRSLGEKLARIAGASRAAADAVGILDEDELDLLVQEQTMAPEISELPELLRATARDADSLRARVSSGGRPPRRDGLLIHLLASEWERAFDVRPAASRNGHFGRCLSILSNRIGIPSAGEEYIASVLRESMAAPPAKQGAKPRE